jgi:hypothetical protein
MVSSIYSGAYGAYQEAHNKRDTMSLDEAVAYALDEACG